jgi:hypothetical protein
MNHLCIIEGEYQVSRRAVADLKAHLKLNASGHDPAASSRVEELINIYKQSISDQDARALSVVYSKDGSELLSHLLNTHGLGNLLTELNATSSTAESLAKTIHHFTTTSNLASSGDSVVNIHTSISSNVNFICFIINDFDQYDQVFIKLEEIQLKINNLLSLKSDTASSATTSTSALAVNNQQPHKRFIIFGWPVLHHCLLNQIVNSKNLFLNFLSFCVFKFSPG